MIMTYTQGLKCFSLAILLGIGSVCNAQTPTGNPAKSTYESFDQLAAEYNERISAQADAFQGREDKFLQNYRQRLEGFKGQYLQEGNLDGYVETKNFLEKFDRQRIVESAAKQKGLAEYFKETLDADAALKADFQKALFAIRTAYINKCIILKREFTKQGKIEDALNISRFLDKLNAETQQEQNSIARNELIKLFDNVTSPDASILVEVFKRNVRESGLAEASLKYTSSQLRDNYRHQLGLLEQRYQAGEDIDGLLAVNKELARHNNFGELSEENIVARPRELRDLQQNYFKALSDAVKKLNADIGNADKMLLASLYKAMSTDAYREDALFKQAVDTAIEEFKNLKTDVVEEAVLAEEGLIAYYPFNGNAKDESGNDHHASLSGNEIYSAGILGPTDKSIYIPPNGFIHLPPSEKSMSPAMTYSLWFKTGSNILRDQPNNFICTILDSGPNRHPLLFVNANWGNFASTMDIGFWDGSWHGSGVKMAVATWTHFVVVMDGNNYRLYINGRNVFNNGGYFGNMGNPVKNIGNFPDDPNTHSARGFFDEVRIYSRVLSEDEIKELYLAGQGK